ncbi:MAG: hypothetical protein A2X31_00030 [Elusimicrobia bacterium GWB2_63_22]|nr:MAG: hypothetical protein A2X31_00030 [Elusimicrobia bacterium GWB2_63_22]
MNKIKEAWAMVKLSGRVLGRNPFLVAYILASGLGVSVLFGAALTPVALNLNSGNTQFLEPYANVLPAQADRKKLTDRIEPHWAPLGATAAAVYFAGTLIIVFFNVAFLASVKRIINGKKVTFKEGLGLAWERRGAVLQWALFSATVGVLINALKGYLDNWLARRVLGLAELGWRLAVFLALPVVAAEGLTPLQALRRSGDIFRKTWGQTFAGGLGIGAFQLAVWLLVGVVPGIVLFYLGLYNTGANYGLALAGVGWMPLSLILIGLVGESMLMVLRMVLYVFAVEGVVPEEYKEQECAWFVAPRA